LEKECGAVLSTCRVVTILNEKDEPEIVMSHWRIAVDPNSIADNVQTGGLSCAMGDYETGEIAFIIHQESQALQNLIMEHPITGTRLAGTCHPFWTNICGLVLSGHRKMDGVLYVGWDIAITLGGATVVEMNFPSALGPPIQMKWGGINNSRIGEILSWRAERWLRQNVDLNSRRQIGVLNAASA